VKIIVENVGKLNKLKKMKRIHPIGQIGKFTVYPYSTQIEEKYLTF
jgi:hypothetical protein